MSEGTMTNKHGVNELSWIHDIVGIWDCFYNLSVISVFLSNFLIKILKNVMEDENFHNCEKKKHNGSNTIVSADNICMKNISWTTGIRCWKFGTQLPVSCHAYSCKAPRTSLGCHCLATLLWNAQFFKFVSLYSVGNCMSKLKTTTWIVYIELYKYYLSMLNSLWQHPAVQVPLWESQKPFLKTATTLTRSLWRILEKLKKKWIWNI